MAITVSHDHDVGVGHVEAHRGDLTQGLDLFAHAREVVPRKLQLIEVVIELLGLAIVVFGHDMQA